jgi:hypothetical protein
MATINHSFGDDSTMNTKNWQNNPLLSIALMGFMALTRFDHFGSAFSLPDASLAVFFFAGFGINSLWFFTLLVLEAGGIDYLAISQFAVSDFCVTPAYFCLIPTYAVMWLAGRYCKMFSALHFAESLRIFASSAIAISFAFFISNGSFYLLSGSFGELSLGMYLQQLAHYYPPYFTSALIYIVIGLAFYRLLKSIKVATVAQS